MSRIGKQPIVIPAGVEVTLHGNLVTVKGSKGTLSFATHVAVSVEVADNMVTVAKVGREKDATAIWGTTAKIISNMIEGVAKGFEKRLELQGVGYRMSVSGKQLTFALGFSHPVLVTVPSDLEVRIEAEQLVVSGIDRQRVGQFAAEIRSLKPVEPYKGKGFRYVGEHVRMKEGKKAGSA